MSFYGRRSKSHREMKYFYSSNILLSQSHFQINVWEQRREKIVLGNNENDGSNNGKDEKNGTKKH